VNAEDCVSGGVPLAGIRCLILMCLPIFIGQAQGMKQVTIMLQEVIYGTLKDIFRKI